MKITKYFVAALAMMSVVACSKDDGSDAVLESSKKSIAITIANAKPDSRGGSAGVPDDKYESGNTPAGAATACATADQLKVLFANNAGVVLQETAIDGMTPEEDGSYLFHGVSEAVTKVAVVRYEAGDITTVIGTTNLSAYKALAENASYNVARPIDEIVLYGEDLELVKNGTCTATNGTAEHTYPLYEAEIEVAPAFARLEISRIKCTDLGDMNKDTDQETYGFDELVLNSFTFTNATHACTLPQIETKVLSGSYAAKNGDAWDMLDSTDPIKNSIAPETDVWSWNLAPNSAFEPMTLDMTGDAADWKVNDGHLTLTISSLLTNAADPASKVTTYAKNSIYQMAVDFSEKNLDPRNQNICVKVTVTIEKWVVVPVTPVFGKVEKL